MNKHLTVKLLLTALIVLWIVFPTEFVQARTSAEIEQDIIQKQKDLQKTQSDLSKAQQDYANYQNALKNSKGGLPALQAQIAEIDSQIKLNNSQKAVFEDSKKLKELQKAEGEALQKESLKDTYMQWRSQNYDDDVIVSLMYKGDFDYKKVEEYTDVVTSNQQQKILGLAVELQGIANNISDFDKKLGDLNSQNAQLQEQRKKIEAEIAFYNSKVTASGSTINNLQSNVKTLQGNISSLSQEQKLALQKEAQILNQTGGNAGSIGGCGTFDNNNNDNTVNFCGIGRDNYQGHSVGFSQWGAHGMGKLGWDFQTIVKFYYTGIAITGGYEGRNVNVSGYGNMNIEDYVAGQGEVPAKACGTQAQASANPAKYVADNPNTAWDCWPESTIKAFVIAYRTYAVSYVNRSGSICATASCQVYKGGSATKWAADETRGMVATYGGQVIEALYSADNNQGFGTANNDTRFQSYNGNGTVTPYLRSVNDNAYSTKTSYTNWGYKTNNYTMADINNLMNHVASNSGIYGGVSSYIAGLKSRVGTITSLSFERDPSKRVKRVIVKGSNGTTDVIGGYWFKYIWNLWIYNNGIKKPDGNYDYIFSQTFFLHVV